MAKIDKKPAVIHYRRLEDVAAAFKGSTLEQEVRKALDVASAKGVSLKSDFHLRVWTPIPNGDSLFINQYSDANSYLFGDLVHFVHGHMQALFEAVPKPSPTAPVKQMPAQGGEFIHSLLYWYIRGNHVFVLQGRTARTVELEKYLSWLLAALGKGGTPLNILLRSKFDPAAVGGDLQDIEEINIGGLLRPPVAMPPEDGTTLREVVEDKTAGTFEGGGRNLVADVIRAVTGDQNTADEFLNRVDQRAQLKVRVTIGLKSRRVQVDRQPLKELEVGLRNLGEADVSVKAKGGKRTPLGQLQLTYPTQIAMKESLWLPSDVEAAFQRAYQEFSESGKIDNGNNENET